MRYNYIGVRENIIHFLLYTVIYLSYVKLTYSCHNLICWVQAIYLYRYFEAIYRTQVEYGGSVTRHFDNCTFYMYKKESFVTVLTHVKSAIIMF